MRNEFYDRYIENRIVFAVKTYNKIDAVLQSIDAYIEEYEKGLTLAKDLKIIEPKSILINGVWSVEVIEKIILRLEETIQEMEKEFKHCMKPSNNRVRIFMNSIYFRDFRCYNRLSAALSLKANKLNISLILLLTRLP